MGLFDETPYLLVDDEESDHAKFNNTLLALKAALNEVEAVQFAAGKIFDLAKLMDGGANAGDSLVFDGVDWAPGAAAGFSTGDVKWSARRAPENGWLKIDGSAVSRTTYADLFAAIVPSLGTFTVTIASPAVITNVGHGLVPGDKVYFTTSGALPTGLAANTLYYVDTVPTADTFTVAATDQGAAINTSGSQSGIHTLRACPWGLGDGSTTFNLPQPGRLFVPPDVSQTEFRSIGRFAGAKTHTLAGAEIDHTHGTEQVQAGTGVFVATEGFSTGNGGTYNTTAHNNLQPYQVMHAFIKT